MGRKPKVFPHIPATMEEVVQAIFRPNAEFVAKKQRELRKEGKLRKETVKKKSNKAKYNETYYLIFYNNKNYDLGFYYNSDNKWASYPNNARVFESLETTLDVVRLQVDLL